MVSRQLLMGFSVGLTTAAVVTLIVFYILVLRDKRKKALASQAGSSVGERYHPEGNSQESPYRSEYSRDNTAFEPVDRPLQHRSATPFSSLSNGHLSNMDQSSLTGTGSNVHSLGRPTLAFGAPSRLHNGRPVNYSNGRVEHIYREERENGRNQEQWRDRPVSPRYHNRGMRTNVPNGGPMTRNNNNYHRSVSQTESRSVEGYLNNNIFGLTRSFNDSGYSDTVIRPQPLGGDSAVDDSEQTSSHSGSYIPAFMTSTQDFPVRLHRQELTTHNETNEDSYF